MAAPALAGCAGRSPCCGHDARQPDAAREPTDSRLIYFSSASENTSRFIEKLGA